MAIDLMGGGTANPQHSALEYPDTYIWTVLSLVCAIIALLPFVLPAIPVGSDACKHLMVARVLADYNDPTLRYFDYFAIEWRPVPTSLGDLLLAAFVKIFPPIAALKAYFVAIAIGLWLGGRFYLRQAGQHRFAVILLLPLLQSFWVFSAFLPFIGSIVLYPLLLGLLTGFPPGVRKSAWLALILMGMYGFHIVGAAIGCFTVLMFAVRLKRPRVLWYEMLSVVPTAGLIAYYEITKPRDTAPPVFYAPIGQIKSYIGFNVWSLSPTATWLFVAVLFFFALVFLWHVRGGRMVCGRLIFVSLLLVIVGLFLPYQMGAGAYIGARTLPFAFIAAVGALKWNQRLLRASMVLVCIFLVISSALNTSRAFAVQTSLRVFLSGIAAVRPGSKVLPIIEDLNYGGNRYIQPFDGVEDLYNIYRGGANPYVFAEPFVGTGGNLLRAKYPLSFISKYSPHPQAVGYRGVSMEYDYIICWGQLPTIKRAIESESSLVFENGLLSIYSKSQNF
jgi:hypothetical protein